MMAGWCDTCFCFRDIRRAIVAIGMFSGLLSMVQILVTIAVFTGMMNYVQMSPESKEVMTYRLYIALACFDFVMVICSFVLIFGNESNDDAMGRCYMMPWVIFVPFYVIFETAVNIYYFYYQFNDKYQGPLYDGAPLGFAIVPLVYWIIKDVILFVSFMFVVIRIQSMGPSVRYVRQVEPCHECTYCPAPAPVRMALPQAPSIPRPALPACTSCSGGGGCNADRCQKCNLPTPTPMYGYAGFNNAGNNAGRSGWTTSVYNTGGF